MASSLVVEDGSGVAGANSYTTLADARAYLALRGLSISATDTTAEQQLFEAMDYIEALRDRFGGAKTNENQALQWPRTGAFRDGATISPESIPPELPQAQAVLAWYVAQGTPLQPSSDGRQVLSESVGPISTTYAVQSSTNPQPALTRAQVLLDPLLATGDLGTTLETERA